MILRSVLPAVPVLPSRAFVSPAILPGILPALMPLTRHGVAEGVAGLQTWAQSLRYVIMFVAGTRLTILKLLCTLLAWRAIHRQSQAGQGMLGNRRLNKQIYTTMIPRKRPFAGTARLAQACAKHSTIVYKIHRCTMGKTQKRPFAGKARLDSKAKHYSAYSSHLTCTGGPSPAKPSWPSHALEQATIYTKLLQQRGCNTKASIDRQCLDAKAKSLIAYSLSLV